MTNKKIFSLDKAKDQILKNLNGIDKSILEKQKIYFLRDVLSKINLIAREKDKESISSLIDKIYSGLEDWKGGIFFDDEFFEEIEKDKDLKAPLIESISNILWIEKNYHLNSWKVTEKNPDSKFEKKSNIVCFYSYKGGVGRTTLASYCAIALAENKKVVIVDADLEAPGLIDQFFPRKADLYRCNGLLDFFLFPNIDEIRSEEFKENFFFNHSSFPNLHLIPASSDFEIESNGSKPGDLIESYYQKISRFTLSIGGEEKIEKFIHLIQESINPDLIMFDLRTGITDIAGLFTTNILSDLNVFVGYPDNQSKKGIEFFVKNRPMPKEIQDEDNDFYPNIMFVHSPAPLNAAGKIEEKNSDDFVNLVSEFLIDEKLKKIIKEDKNEIFFSIPYNPYLRTLVYEKGVLGVYKDKDIHLENYKKVAERIFELLLIREDDTDLPPSETVEKTVLSNYEDTLDDLVKTLKSNPISDEAAISERDLNDDEKIKKNYQFIKEDFETFLNEEKFILIGEKGSGKSALQKILVKRESSIKSSKKFINIVAIEALTIQRLLNSNPKAWKIIQETYFWKQYTFQIIKSYHKNKGEKLNIDNELENLINNYNPNMIEKDDEILNYFYGDRETLIISYDNLDEIPLDKVKLTKGDRNKIIENLLLFWRVFLSNKEISSMVRCKIFLRTDILHQLEYEDITRIRQVNSYRIDWTFEKVISIFFKRLLSRSVKFQALFSKYIAVAVGMGTEANVGIIFPYRTEEINTAIINFFGEKIGQPISRKWLERYLWSGLTSGGNNIYNPRFMLQFLNRILSEAVTDPNKYFKINRKLKNFSPITILLYDKRANKSGLFTDKKELYGQIAKDWVEGDFIKMYPGVKNAIIEFQKAIASNRAKFKSYPNTFTDDELKKVKDFDGEMIQTLVESGFLVENVIKNNKKKEYFLPEIYRAAVGISKTNSLSPNLEPLKFD